MSDLADIIEAYIEKFDGLREVFFQDDATCYLLEGDGETESFKPRTQLTGGWYLKYSEFRGFFKLYYATTDANFARILSLSGYVAKSGEVYEIDESETVPPQGAKPFWTIACKRIGSKKFTLPES